MIATKRPSVWTQPNLTILLGSTMTVMAGATISPALPAIERAFSATPNAALLTQLALTMPALIIALSAPIAGVLLDRIGRKPILLAALILYALAGSSGLWLNSLYAILIGRAFLGLAVAGIMSGFSTLIADYFAGAELDRFMGLQAAFTGLGGVVFVLFGGILAEMGWRLPFAIYLLSVLVCGGVLFFIVEPQRAVAETDEKSVFSFRPIFPVYVIAFFGMVIFYLVPTQIPFYLDRLGIRGALVGGAISTLTLMAAVASLQYQRLRARFAANLLFAITFVLMAIGYLVIGAAQSYVLVVVGLVIAGAGLGLLQPNLATWLVPLISAEQRGRAFGGLTTSLFLGQFLSPILFQPVPTATNSGLPYWVGAGISLLLTGWFVQRSFKGARGQKDV